MKNNNKRPLVTYKVETNVEKFMEKSISILSKMNGNKLFSKPPVSYDSVRMNIENLNKSQIEAWTHEIGKAAIRDKMYGIVVKDFQKFQNYVQGLADGAKDEKTAKSIILASGFKLKKVRNFIKELLTAKLDPDSGDLILSARKTVGGFYYEWQTSNDNGLTFTNLGGTLNAKIIASDCLVNQESLFRFRSHSRDGISDYCVAVTMFPKRIVKPLK